MTEKRFYVYVIFRTNGVPCYIGKGCGDRWKIHSGRTHNLHLKSIYKLAGGDLPAVKIRDNLSNREACETEVALIRAIGRASDGGPLVNLTNGGDGASGCKLTDERKRQISEFFKGRVLNENQKKAFSRKGRKNSEQHCLRQSLSKLGTKQSPETIEKRAGKLRGRRRDPAVMAPARAACIGRIVSEETRRKIGLTSRGRKQSPETLAKRMATMEAIRNSPQYKRNLGEAVTSWWERRKSNRPSISNSDRR